MSSWDNGDIFAGQLRAGERLLYIVLDVYIDVGGERIATLFCAGPADLRGARQFMTHTAELIIDCTSPC